LWLPASFDPPLTPPRRGIAAAKKKILSHQQFNDSTIQQYNNSTIHQFNMIISLCSARKMQVP